MLNNSGPDHSECTDPETCGYSPDWCESDVGLAESGVDDAVANGDHDDEGEWVEVGEDVVGQTVCGHGSSLRSQVVVQLVVGEPPEGVPQEHGAGLEATLDFIDPLIVESDPCWTLSLDEPTGLRALPEVVSGHVLDQLDRVPGPSALHRLSPDTHCLAQDGAGGWRDNVSVATEVKNERRDTEHDGGESVRQPETDVFLGVGHGDLTDESANVGEEIEILKNVLVNIPSPPSEAKTYHVDSGGRHTRVADDTLTTLGCSYEQLRALVLFGDERRDIWLESTGAGAHDKDGDDKAGERTMRVLDNSWYGGNDEEDVTDEGNSDRDTDSIETAQMGICNVSTEERYDVHPETVEGSETGGGLLAQTEGTRLTVRAACTGTGIGREGLLNEVRLSRIRYERFSF